MSEAIRKLKTQFNVNSFASETTYKTLPEKFYSYVNLDKLGLPLKDFLIYKKTSADIFQEAGLVRLERLKPNTVVLPENNCRISYVDALDYYLVFINTVSRISYYIKKTGFQTRVITVAPGIIYNESEEILVMITKSLQNDTFTLYLATELDKEPIYKSLVSKIKKHLIKPFEQEDWTIIKMNMRKLTGLFYPSYEEVGDLPEKLTLEFNG